MTPGPPESGPPRRLDQILFVDGVEETRPLGSNCAQSHAPCVLVMHCNVCKAGAPPTTCCPCRAAIFEPRKCLSLWRNPTVHVSKDERAVGFWEDFPGLRSHSGPEGPQHRGESAAPETTMGHFSGGGRPSAAAVGIGWPRDPWCFAYRCRLG